MEKKQVTPTAVQFLKKNKKQKKFKIKNESKVQ